MFIDSAKIYVKAGDGGSGHVSFYRAKYVPKGGPDGGNGGRGGSVYLVADQSLTTLQDFRYKRKYVAPNGERGGTGRKAGRSGEDLTIRVPLGTVLRDADTGDLLQDFTEDGQRYTVAEGGRGGVGNAVFATATRQSPNFARPGVKGEEHMLSLELKLLADVGLVGLPNVGKSTFLSVVTSARPKIADYHFTTLEPVLGIAQVGDTAFTIADIPGLIEDAHQGVGLGLDFLRHVERTRLLVHVLDVSGSEGRDPLEDYRLINNELRSFSEDLAARPQIAALNKIDMADDEDVERVREALEAEGLEVFEISAPIHHGTQELLNAMARKLQTIPPTVLYEVPDESVRVYELAKEPWKIDAEDDIFEVSGDAVDQLLRSVNLEDTESLQWFQLQLRKQGIIDGLTKAGIKEGDTVVLGEIAFDYIP